MKKIIPEALQRGDKICVIAPSRGLKIIGQETRQIAFERFKQMGLSVQFATHTTDENWDMMGSTSIENRVADIHEAFSNKSIKGIFTIIGGANSNQLLPYLDYDLIRTNPKILCGFSDITALLNGISAQTGLVTFLGPHYSSLGMKKGIDYTLQNLEKMLFSPCKNQVVPSEEWSDDLWFLDQENRTFLKNEGHWVIHSGSAQGTIIGGNLGTFNLLLGTKYRPTFEENTILFIEDTEGSDIADFERNLQALLYQPDFGNVKGLIIGRFQKGSKVTREQLDFIINTKKELQSLPIIANVDFGHSTPLLTIPLGGQANINNSELFMEL